jgi:type VI secretion system protein ImpH
VDSLPVNLKLIDEPYRFEFFQAVRLIERIYSEAKPVGAGAMPNEEPVRFRSRVAMDFPASEIHEIIEPTGEEADESKPMDMLVNFMGMVGVSGVLPVHYTELALDRIRHRDTALWAFLDIFTHRAVSMFFRAWCKYRFPIQYERGSGDDFTASLFDLAGLGTNALKGRMHLEDESLLPYTGLIAQKPHSASVLANILSDYFSIPAKICQFFGQWLDLDKDDYTKLGVANVTLGHTTVIGARIWDQMSNFRVKLGPLPFSKFQDFLPTGSAHQSLRSLIQFIVGTELDFDVQLSLAAQQVPGLILTTHAKRRPMLGWTSWLKSTPFKNDDEQVILEFSV